MTQKITDLLTFIYGEEQADSLSERLNAMIAGFRAQHAQFAQPSAQRFSERDAILITYGDMVQRPAESPLQTLAHFVDSQLKGVISGVHLLPFYPYSSDDGFSVIDYHAVNPDLGDWHDVAQVGRNFRLMFDAVINHISAHSEWFQAFLRDEQPYTGYFTVVDPNTDLSTVFRPRALPLLSAFQTPSGEKHVWTTFSADQIDLNYDNPELLLDVMKVMFDYVARGAELIRLDAIGFMWKEIGTSCIHLPQAHAIIQLMRLVLDEVAPQVVLITETNVPHQDNISYFGDGRNEAQMVYNFTLPPLTLYSFHTGDATALTKWANILDLPSDEVTFFNFLASHDGIGVTPTRGILSQEEVHQMGERVKALGGFVSYKTNSDGSQSPYELNINYLDAVGDPNATNESTELFATALKARRFLASQAIMLALRGVPGIYFHSLFGSRNWREGVAETGRYRTINRQKLVHADIEAELADPNHLRHHVFTAYCDMLRVRTSESAFHPSSGQQILSCHKALFALLRTSLDGTSHVLCLHNVSNASHNVAIDLNQLPIPPTDSLTELISGQQYVRDGHMLRVEVGAYQVLWLKVAHP